MITVRELADRLGVPNFSVVQSMQALCQLQFTDDQYVDMIREVRGIEHKIDPIPGKNMAKYAFRFFYQDQMTSELKGLPANPDSTFLNALVRARRYIDTNSWVFATRKEEDEIGEDGKPVPKKGDKKVLAKKVYEENKHTTMTRKQWIALLVKEVGLSDAGASTYYANLKAGKY